MVCFRRKGNCFQGNSGDFRKIRFVNGTQERFISQDIRMFLRCFPESETYRGLRGLSNKKVMVKNPIFAILTVTAYLAFFAVITRLLPVLPLLFIMYAISPLLVIWMVYTVIRYGRYNGKELREGQEWGYEDVD